MTKIPPFAPMLLKWYVNNKRELPWRETVDPYAIWLSEVILQQTRIDQGLSYYLKFIEAYPTVKDFARAPEDDILKLWQGLGYYSRARNMHITAKKVATELNGQFPADYNGLLKLKGIGEYTAAAISSIAFNLPHAAVDGNVFRVLSRMFGIETPIDSTEGKKIFLRLANDLLDKKRPGEFNQALMELGALQCTPKNPNCLSCPLQNTCYAYKNNTISLYPIKRGKTKIRKRYFNYLVIQEDDHTTYLSKRTQNDIWKNLYEFPLVETDKKNDEFDLLLQNGIYSLNSPSTKIKWNGKWQKQILSHQHIFYRFIYLRPGNKKNIPSFLIKVNKKDIFSFAVPKPIEKELEQNNWF